MSSQLYRMAKLEIEVSEPFFIILSVKSISFKLQSLIIKEVPSAFVSVITQLSRHILNKSLTTEEEFHQKYKKILFLLSDPDTTTADKKLVITFEPCDFIKELYLLCYPKVHHGASEENVHYPRRSL